MIRVINIGTVPNDNTGDSIRVGGQKINDNFSDLNTDVIIATAKADAAIDTLNGKINYTDFKNDIVELDFENGENFVTTTYLCDWITEGMVFNFQFIDSIDHTVEESLVSNIQLNVNNIIEGISFDINAFSPDSNFGIYYIRFLAY